MLVPCENRKREHVEGQKLMHRNDCENAACLQTEPKAREKPALHSPWSQTSGLRDRENPLLFLKPPHLQSFVTASRAD